MPRLLLVDDNPSIHRIAESLLTGTSVDLVCVESGEEALRRINGGEHFDVALLDTVLGPGGMDGWALLDRLRQTPATAKLPIALMAGVLDAVDPLMLEKAPIQGFLRKPIELRDLDDRIRAYMSAPVEGVGRGTVPGAKLQDWMSESAPAPAPARGPEPDGDLLVLMAEDLLDPEPQSEPVPSPEPELHLEELDLDTLHGATLLPAAAAIPVAGAIAASGIVSTPESAPHAETELPPIPSLNLDEPLSHEMLAGLGAASAIPAAVTPALPVMPAMPTPAELPDMELETLHGVALDLPVPPAATPEPAPIAASAPAAMGEGAGHAAVQAILSDPAAREALIKALLAQGGEQVLREVAWEVMPDLASKLQK